MSISSDFLQDI